MSNVRQIIRGALLRLVVLDSNSEPTAEEARDTLAVLNRMLFAFKAKGVDLGHSTLNLSDDLLNPEYEEGLVAMLAVRAAPEFGKAADDETRALAIDGERQIMADFMGSDLMEMDPGLLRMPSARLFGWA